MRQLPLKTAALEHSLFGKLIKYLGIMRSKLQILGIAVVYSVAFRALAQEAVDPPPSAKLFANVIDIAPWGMAGPDGHPRGIYSTIFRQLAKRSGCVIEQRLTPIPRAVVEVARGAVQATIMLDRDDLNRNAVSIGEVTSLYIEVWLPPGSKLRKLSDLEGRTVGVLRGPTYHEAFDRNDQIRKYFVLNPRQQLEMIMRGRLDAAIGVRENFKVAASQMNLLPSTFAPPIEMGRRVVKLWVAPNLPPSNCANRLGSALQEMRGSGEIEKIIAEGSK